MSVSRVIVIPARLPTCTSTQAAPTLLRQKCPDQSNQFPSVSLAGGHGQRSLTHRAIVATVLRRCVDRRGMEAFALGRADAIVSELLGMSNLRPDSDPLDDRLGSRLERDW